MTIPKKRMQPDIAANRSSQKWTVGELLARGAWEYAGSILFRLTPRPFWAARRFILIVFGARIGRQVHIFPSVRIAIPWHLDIGEEAAVGDRAILYSLGRVTIGARTTISQGAHLCAGTHDHTSPAFPLLKSPITIGEGCWICADAFIGPGVTVGDLAIVGARAAAMRDVRPLDIVAGNPAVSIGTRSMAEAP